MLWILVLKGMYNGNLKLVTHASMLLGEMGIGQTTGEPLTYKGAPFHRVIRVSDCGFYGLFGDGERESERERAAAASPLT